MRKLAVEHDLAPCPSPPPLLRTTVPCNAHPSKMSMLAMATPSPHSSFARDYPWEGPRALSDLGPRQSERISLPSIRQAFPELQLRIPSPQDSARTPSTTTGSPKTGATVATPPDYTHSPNSNKRRRYSIDDETSNERASRVPRLYTAPRQPSPVASQRTPATESWAGSARTSPFLPSGAMPVVHSPPTMHLPDRSVEMMDRRPNVPHMALPQHVVYEREQPILRAKAHSHDDYPVRPAPPPPPPMAAAPLEAHHQPPLRHNPFAYHTFHHPTRVQSLSVGSTHPFERHYAPAAYGPPHYHPDFVRYGDMNHSGDTRQRKRRGNLPKETTDKLRAWFVAHLHHPYPTEDEKQELMRQTGLQMSESSLSYSYY